MANNGSRHQKIVLTAEQEAKKRRIEKLLSQETILMGGLGGEFDDEVAKGMIFTDRQLWGIQTFSAMHMIPVGAVMRTAVAAFLEAQQWKGCQTWHFEGKEDCYQMDRSLEVPRDKWIEGMWTHRRKGWEDER